MPALLRRCAAAALCAAALAYAAFSFGGVLRIVARDRLAPRRPTAYPRAKCRAMDAARVAAAERRGRGAANGTAAVAALQSYYVDAGVEAAWPVVANATAANHAAYAAAHGLPYARAAPAGARARCGKLRAVGAALADAPAGKWLVFADADLSFACATATPPGAGLDRALRLAARAGGHGTGLLDLVVADRFGLFAARRTRWARRFLARLAAFLDARPALCALSPMPENAAFEAVATPRDRCRVAFVSDPAFAAARHLVGAAAKRDADRAAAFADRAARDAACLRKEAKRRRRAAPAAAPVALRVVPEAVENADAVNPSAELVLAAVVETPHGALADVVWSGPFRDADLLTPAAQRVDAGLVYLVVRAGVLAPGEAYEFELVATSGGDAAAATIAVTTNAPPRSGRLAVAPAAGVALLTEFALSLDGWVDDQLPLAYAFYHRLPGETAATQIAASSEAAAAARLPRGGGGGGVRVVVGEVSDALGAAARVGENATVAASDLGVEALDPVVEELLDESLGAADPDYGGALATAVAATGEIAPCGDAACAAVADLRGDLVDALATVVDEELPRTQLTVQRQASAAAALTARADELEPAASGAALDAVAVLASASAAAGLAEGTADGVFAALDALLGGGTLAVDEQRGDAFAGSLDDLSAALALGLVPGEAAAELAGPHGAMAVARLETIDAAAATFAASADPRASRVALPASWADEAVLVDVAVAEFVEDPRPALPTPVETTVVRVRAARFADDETAGTARRLDDGWRADQAAAAADALVVELRRVADPPADWSYAVSYVVAVNCSSGAAPPEPCRGTTAAETRDAACGGRGACGGVANATCSSATAATCLRYVSGDDWDADACVVVESGDDATVCACAADAAAADYAAASSQESYARYLRTVFRRPLDGDLLTTGRPLFRVFLGLATFWALAGLAGARLDRRDAAAAAAKPRPSEARRRSSAVLGRGASKHLETLEAHLSGDDASRDAAAAAHFKSLKAALPHAIAKGSYFRKTARRSFAARWPLLSLCRETLRRHHDWVSIYDAYDAARPRLARCALMLFDAVQLYFGGAVACFFFVIPPGLCKSFDPCRDERSCENVRSFRSFGTGGMCEWDASYDEPCVFREPSGGEETVLDLQVTLLGLAIALPLIALVNWAVETYVFAPTGDGGDDGDDVDALADAGARLLHALGVDAAVDLGDADAVARAALPAATRVVLRQREELVDALDAERDPRRAEALAALLRAHDGASRYRRGHGAVAAATLKRVGAALEAAAHWGGALTALDGPAVQYRALCQLRYAHELAAFDAGIAHALYLEHGARGGAAAPPAAVSRFAKASCYFFLFVGAAAQCWFMTFYAREIGRKETRIWADGTILGYFLLFLLVVPARLVFAHVLAPRLLDPHFRHIGDPFEESVDVPFRHALPTPVDLVDPRLLGAMLDGSRAVVAPVAETCRRVSESLSASASADERPSDPAAPKPSRRAAVREAVRAARADAGGAADRRAANRAFREERADAWAADRVAAAAKHGAWRPPLGTALGLGGLAAFFLLHEEVQAILFEEAANLAAHYVILAALFVVRGRGDLALVAVLVVVFGLLVYVCLPSLRNRDPLVSRVSSVDDAAREAALAARDGGGDEDAVAAGTLAESDDEDAARESTALEKFAESDDEDAALKEAIAAHEEDTLARFAESDAGDDEPLRSLPSRKPSRLEALFDDDAGGDEPLRSLPSREPSRLEGLFDDDAGDDEPLRSLPPSDVRRRRAPSDDDALVAQRTGTARGAMSSLIAMFTATGGDDDTDDDRAAPRESVRRRRAPSDDDALVAQRTGTAPGAVSSLIAIFTGGDDDAEPGCIQ
ncbi:hypothetical protein AURANDRAFT_60735 [Aureococcus anophagefferens]|uniref:PKD/REJ-like domain-containing protein n=1 Tax=Aureococcus anophagefferens TaxID=44056 RepID=F0XW61_AURAN|nr:hypothetical protein AURANDRAFT_60735 [Aureococcus anophagefferens]EGB13023.1 hypothetical protein AURANDRAFT_60735 [Aureococcus anophagefferens]|eukprot:XP_009032633.1 hypothetical protein AURANDRAFT_60735 [Aureococcus anophagefferens]